VSPSKETVVVPVGNPELHSSVARLRNPLSSVDACDKTQDVRACDLRLKSHVSALFQDHSVRAVIHLAGILPSAFQNDPLTGADVNLSGSVELMRQSLAAGVQRFIFASSMSVYGSPHAQRPVTEDDAAAPDEAYGASKRAVELIGKSLSEKGAFEFVALRIARVVGPGIKKTSSPWRSQIFEAVPQSESIRVPFSPDAMLSLVHVEDVARMLFAPVEPRLQLPGNCHLSRGEFQLRWKSRRKVASFVKSTSEAAPVILLTGRGQRLMAEGDVPAHVDRVISKPPKLRDLREALALCLSPPGSEDSQNRGHISTQA
jgi:nucleoside-diphosphate-sugar epimerase